MESVLLVSGDPNNLLTIRAYLSTFSFRIYTSNNIIEGIELAERYRPDILITDLKMSEEEGFKLLKEVKEFCPGISVIMLSEDDDNSSTLRAMQLGAYDVIDKPFEICRLHHIVNKVFETKRLSENLESALSERGVEDKIGATLIGKTPVMKDLIKKIGTVTASKVNILVTGESGTGKELIAKIIHYSGIAKNQPFIAVNCSVLSENLLESELFGHVNGAFTGAIRDKKGKFEMAGEGTILLDEISEISPSVQVKLLRVIQEREFEKVGGEATIPVKARIIANTNQNLEELVKQGRFRKDLYYRLKVFSIDVPPLRERKDDIPHLVTHFLKKINRELNKNVTKIPYEVMEMFRGHDWTGNVRELENSIMQAVVLAKGDVLEKDNIFLSGTELTKKNNAADKPEPVTLAEVEKKYISDILDTVNWDKQKAHKILGISRTTLYSKIETYGLTCPN